MLLNRKLFFVREHVALLKLTDTFDILDPETSQPIGIIKEEPGVLVKILRVISKKSALPTRINAYETEGQPPVFTIKRGFTFIRAKTEVLDHAGNKLGYMKSKLLTIGGGLNVFDNDNRKVAEIKGDWRGWNFQMVDDSGRQLGTISRSWGGLARELFTSADNYVVAIDPAVSSDAKLSTLLLAAAISLDMAYKENE